MELAVTFIAFVVFGAARPRWTSLLVAVVPAALACVWLFLHEDIPGYETGITDVAWYVGMSVAIGAAYALAYAGGVGLRRALDR
jgi:hypothetical protein